MVDILSKITGFASSELLRSTGGYSNDTTFGFAFIFIIIAVIFIICLISYIYTSLAYYRISKKLRTEHAWLNWIPIANVYMMSKMAKMHWWPILLFIPYYILLVLFFVTLFNQMFLLAILIFFIALIPMIVMMIYWVIWHWKIFERLSRPGWWILLIFIPYAGGILYLVFLGIAAWGKDSVPIEDKKIKRK